MSQRIDADLTEDELNGGATGGRPVRLRRSKKRAAPARTRVRKAASPNGIHRRANKRIAW